MRPSIIIFLRRIFLRSGRSWRQSIQIFSRLIAKLLSNPQIAELWRFIFLGSIVETGRIVGQKVVDVVSSFFMVKATFFTDDFCYDWVKAYLEHIGVWDESRSFQVSARNPALVPGSNSGSQDGHPEPLYEATQAPELFRWKGYWMSITKDQQGYIHAGAEKGGRMVLRVWTRDRSVLDAFLLEARQVYVQNTRMPPRKLEPNEDISGSLLTAHFAQNDWSHDWMLSFLRSENALRDIMEFSITTKQSDLGWGTGPKDAVRYLPAPDAKQMFLYKSSKTGRNTWMQVTVRAGHEDFRGKVAGGSITILVHSSDRDVLAEIIEEARCQYMQSSASRVTVHLTDNYGSWAKTVTKSRRALSTLVLQAEIKENLLEDMNTFLESSHFYSLTGIPHRRGYLLYGHPGTGKSSTIHAMAGELGLEIYSISLASPGIDDYNLQKLISDTPSRSILLLEDIDCAFPSREDDDDEPDFDQNGNPLPKQTIPPRSQVTLAGLLNVLDSITSEEGRITFATTNHIEMLDPALIRAGRMDVKVEYKLATSDQIEMVFRRFFPDDRYAIDADDITVQPELEQNIRSPFRVIRKYTKKELQEMASQFAKITPSGRYSVAELQGYLLTKKVDPSGALKELPLWLKAQEDEKASIQEIKRKRREDAAKRRKEFKDMEEKLRAEEAARNLAAAAAGLTEQSAEESSDAETAPNEEVEK
ncbi:P-loop containing nucleoside triphosphate hydrolase protein [Mycena floridula]|nr:P-loop containing nucleoside triphosphate hydrolase protein [Mycena floridula]